MALNFDNPVFLSIAVLCVWTAVFFPFAIWARQIARPDAYSGVEAWILGQVCGPVGIVMVKRANEAARLRAERRAFESEHRAEPEVPEVYDRKKRITDGIPGVTDLPGGRAFKPPPTHQAPKSGPAKMDTWPPPDQ